MPSSAKACLLAASTCGRMMQTSTCCRGRLRGGGQGSWSRGAQRCTGGIIEFCNKSTAQNPALTILYQRTAANTSHHRQDQQQRVKEGKLVFASVDADADSRQDLRRIRKVPSSCMCNSSSEERTWVELSREVLQECVANAKDAAGSAAAQPSLYQRASSEKQNKNKKQGGTAAAASSAATGLANRFIFKERRMPAAAAGKKK